MEEKTIKGTSLSVINNWVKVLEFHIDSGTLFIDYQDYIDNDFNYLSRFNCCDKWGDGDKDKKILIMDQDVMLILLMMNKVFPDLFTSLELSPTHNCIFFILREDCSGEIIGSIQERLVLVKRIVAMSLTGQVNN